MSPPSPAPTSSLPRGIASVPFLQKAKSKGKEKGAEGGPGVTLPGFLEEEALREVFGAAANDVVGFLQ